MHLYHPMNISCVYRSCKSLTEGIINTEDEDEDIILTQSLMGGLSGKATPSVMHQVTFTFNDIPVKHKSKGFNKG